ncbi:MAG: AraC family transcriptional regulator [Novosphingobium sp.]
MANIEGALHTGLSAWILAIFQGLEASGIDAGQLMQSIGMDAAKVGDLQYRYSQEQVTNLWVAAVNATGDENFGLMVARHVRPSTFHVVGYAMSCSATLKRAAERFAHSTRLISDSAVVDFKAVEGGYRLEMDLSTGGRPPIYQTIDTMLAGFFILSEWILAKPILPLEVQFRHEPPLDPSAYVSMFRIPVTFEAQANAIVFRTEDLEQPVPSANEELAMVLDEMTSNYLALRYGQRFSRKVRDVLARQLPLGEPNKRDTARMLAMTERTLLRRLRNENTTYREVLDRLREEMAFSYLRNRDLTIEQIAVLLGFSGSNALSRAFVRWTGQRPSHWRENQRQLEGG